MKPTMKLRWYRQFSAGEMSYIGGAPVLQQWWEPEMPESGEGEWRDVPMHIEPWKP